MPSTLYFHKVEGIIYCYKEKSSLNLKNINIKY